MITIYILIYVLWAALNVQIQRDVSNAILNPINNKMEYVNAFSFLNLQLPMRKICVNSAIKTLVFNVNQGII